MPLEKSTSKESQSRNIAELRHSGYPERQAIAISYSVKRQAEKEREEHEKKKYGK